MVAERLESGFSTLEILIAFSVIVFCISATTVPILEIHSNLKDMQIRVSAEQLISQKIREAQILSSHDFEGVQNTEYQKNGLLVKQTVEDVDSWTKLVKVIVSWTDLKQNQRDVERKSVVTNWQLGLGSSTCDLILNGDWAHPQITGSTSFTLTNKPTGIDVINGFAYITTDSNLPSEPDFYIFDLSIQGSPVIRAALNTGPGLVAVHVAGNFAYVANTSTNSQLQVINISDHTSPQLISSYKIPGVIVSNGAGVGRSLWYAENKIYLGLTKANGPEFNVIDVSDPQNPNLLGSFETNTVVNDIFSSNGLAFIATSTEQQLRAFNVSDPSQITVVSNFSAQGWQRQDGESLSVLGSNIFFGRSVGGFNNVLEHELFGLSFKTDQSFATNFSKDIASSIKTIMAHHQLLFVGTSDSNKEFQLWDITNQSSPDLLSSLDLPGTLVDMDCESSKLYAVSEGPLSLIILKGQE